MSVGLIYALHGFLGRGSDWKPVKDHLQDFEWHMPSLFAKGAGADIALESLKDFRGKKLFLGYSLGGRIGLSLLKSDSFQFDHYFFVSVNPGFSETDLASRDKRIKSDLEWAGQITEANWKNFLNAWNSQSVFEGSAVEPHRDAGDYGFIRLQTALKDWSLGLQPDYSKLISDNKKRITWIVGSEDAKFVAMAEEMKAKSIIDSYVKIKSGHRIPFDSPKKLSEIIRTETEKL